jgi:hypothetical protein
MRSADRLQVGLDAFFAVLVYITKLYFLEQVWLPGQPEPGGDGSGGERRIFPGHPGHARGDSGPTPGKF